MIKIFSRALRLSWTMSLVLPLGTPLLAESPQAYKVFDTTVSLDELMKQEKDKFYEIEKNRYQLIDNAMNEHYLREYWVREGKKTKKSPEDAKDAYMKKNVKVTDTEIKETLEKYKDHPNLKELSAKDKNEQIRNFLQQKGENAIVQTILNDAIKNGSKKILVSPPSEPVYEVKVSKNDHLRYGPNLTDTSPVKGGCSGDDCKITVVEYSEFQCPFCDRALPAIKTVLEKNKGNIRWIVRDFPLSFHPRARPAAIAAKCAGKQGKFWEMYYEIFANQQKLGDTDLKSYAEKIKVDPKEYAACVAKPQEVEKIIDENLASGLASGVSGTPAFFINGRRLSGALPAEEFQRVIDEELTKIDKKS